MFNIKTLLAAVLVVAAAAPSFAQETPRIDRRQENQQARIDQGVQSGKLTNAEAKHMQANQKRIDAAESRAKADGTVTPQERRHVKRMQNRTDRKIARKKHNQRNAPTEVAQTKQ